MSTHARTSASLFLVALVTGLPGVTRADVMTTPTASIPLSPTNWGPTTPALAAVDPLRIPQFDTQNGSLALDSVNVSFHTLLSVTYTMGLVTPGTASGSVATGIKDTPGPVVTLYGPDGKTPLITAQSPVESSLLTNSYTYGLDPAHPSSPTAQFGPKLIDRTYNITLTKPEDLALFTGTGHVSLPATATAVSSITVTSGNGFCDIATKVGVDLTVTYQYHATAAQVLPSPEPEGIALWALGGLGLWFARRYRQQRYG